MKTVAQILIGIAAAVALLLAGVAIWVTATIPPTPDPAALPSSVLEPPSAVFLDVVTNGRALARSLVSEEKLPGLSLAVAVDGKIVWAEGFRWAEIESETPVTPETRFRIGAVSETLTAAAVGLLYERGRLDLDAPVDGYLPGFSSKDWPVSTRHLMAHTAGVRHRPHLSEGEPLRYEGCTDDNQRLSIFLEDPLRFRPGTEDRYSTYGWVLVGAVVAAVANEPYLDFVRREVLAPLGMGDTVPDLAGRIEPGTSQFYYPRMALDPRYGLQEAPRLELSCLLAGAGFLSTPSDLVRLGSAMMGDELLDPATVEELWTPVQLESGESTRQALGWAVESVPMGSRGATRIVGQGLGETVLRRPLSATAIGGQVSGGTASLVVLPEHHIAIAVAANVSGAENVSVLALRLAEAFAHAD